MMCAMKSNRPGRAGELAVSILTRGCYNQCGGGPSSVHDKEGERAQRTDQLLRATGNYTYGSEFLHGLRQSAQLLLRAARAERDVENCLTLHGPSAIMITVTALRSEEHT